MALILVQDRAELEAPEVLHLPLQVSMAVRALLAVQVLRLIMAGPEEKIMWGALLTGSHTMVIQLHRDSQQHRSPLALLLQAALARHPLLAI